MPSRVTVALSALLAAWIGWAAAPQGPAGHGHPFAVASALADDDDSDDGDDDDDDDGGPGPSSRGSDGGGRSSGGGLLNWLFQPEAPRRAARAPARLPDAADDEVVVEGLDQPGLERLLGDGFQVLSEITTASGARVLRLQLPGGVDLPGALRRIGEIAPAATADRNHYYRPQQEGACAAEICRTWSSVGWLVAADRSCLSDVTLGVVDTGINPDHDVFAGARLEILDLPQDRERPSERKHGTAVVAMLVGAPDSRVPGLVPQARVVAADPFTRTGGDERTDVFGLVAALEAVAGAGADVANLSLAGPENRILARRIEAMIAGGTTVVAAVGNAGPKAAPQYPAAYPGVIGVTAVDGSDRVYRRAVRGDQVDFAAPGVAIPTAASISGVRPQTGTSFAVPFVAAAAAMLVATRPDLAPAEIESALAAAVRDLGEPGRDEIFGHGLVQAVGACGSPVSGID